MDKEMVNITLKLIKEHIKRAKRITNECRRNFIQGEATGLALSLRITHALTEEEINQIMKEILFL